MTNFVVIFWMDEMSFVPTTSFDECTNKSEVMALACNQDLSIVISLNEVAKFADVSDLQSGSVVELGSTLPMSHPAWVQTEDERRHEAYAEAVELEARS
tara:strand:+ start:89 stop:385 length:297 start_codon:yes stop_codon:yes gene_type:complete